MKSKKIFIDPLIDNNPITRQVLGICSALAVTIRVEQALVMTLALTFVVSMSNTIISLLRKYIPSSIRIIVQLMVISTLVILIDKILQAYMYEISKTLTVFVTLIITNCIVMGRAEGYAMQNNVKDSFFDGIGNAAGYGGILILVSAFRELFGSGSLLDYQIIPSSIYMENGGWYVNNGLIMFPPGAFIILGLIIWFQRVYTGYKEE